MGSNDEKRRGDSFSVHCVYRWVIKNTFFWSKYARCFHFTKICCKINEQWKMYNISRLIVQVWEMGKPECPLNKILRVHLVGLPTLLEGHLRIDCSFIYTMYVQYTMKVLQYVNTINCKCHFSGKTWQCRQQGLQKVWSCMKENVHW